jgi:methylase of polypeptide subunit release factors
MLQRSTTADLVGLLTLLRAQDYRFTTITPASHRRVIARPGMAEATDLRGVFGWSLPFRPELLDRALLDQLERCDAVETCGHMLRSRLRVSSLAGELFLHSAFPTVDDQSVFFGPDTYRFAEMIACELQEGRGGRLVDIGTGSGAGGIAAAKRMTNARVTLTDINPEALKLAAANAEHAGVEAELIETGSLDGVEGAIDLVLANPPYVIDDEGRTYRDGGGMHGAEISLDWALAAAARLEPGGQLLLYTGVAMVEGRDQLREALEKRLPEHGCTLRYRELDPDVFGEELEKRAYADVERIAAVAAIATKG